MRVLITGGAGFVGTNLVRRLLSVGHSLAVLDDFSTGLSTNLEGLDVEIHQGSVSDVSTVHRAAVNADTIVHLAARGSVPRSLKDPIATHLANATGTLNVLEAARPLGAHVILSSSSSVFGANAKLPKQEDDFTRPMSPYAASKLSAEGYAFAYATSFNLPITVFRFFNIFGPWQRPDHDYAAVIPKWLWSLMNGQAIDVHGDGRQTRDFTYVETVIDVLQRAVEGRVSANGPIHLALGKRLSLMDLIVAMESVLGVSARINQTPSRLGDVRDSQNDPTLLFEYFPDIKEVDLQAALAATANWLRSQ